MAKKGRPKRSNPQAERKIFQAELEKCPICNSRLSSTGNSAHSRKTVQTFQGEQYVVAYSRLCNNSKCEKYKHHYHAVGHLGVALPGETYGLDIVAFIGWQRDREQRRFAEIHKILNQKGVQINERSVGRLYRLYQVLLKSGHKKIYARLVKTEEEYGGLILASDGLKPDGGGGTLYILYEVLSGTPVTAMWQEVADAVHLTAWLRQSEAVNFNVLATMSDHEEALMIALNTVWPDAKHQLCQSHFIGGLSRPIHEADQKLQADLKTHLQKLPKPPKLKGQQEKTDDQRAPKDDYSEATEHSKENLRQQKANQASREPLLTNLLFRQQPISLFERESGLPINPCAVLWDQYYRYYRSAVQDACNRSRRKPFQLGGLAGFQQLSGILKHIEQREQIYGPDPFLSSLQSRLRQAIDLTHSQAEDIRKATSFLQQVEHFLAHIPRPILKPITSSSDKSDRSNSDGWHPIPPGREPKYKVGDIATAIIKQVWQFLFRPIKKIRFRDGHFWYFFEGIGTGYCEDDVLLASTVGKRAEGLIWDGESVEGTVTSKESTTMAQSHSPCNKDSASRNQSDMSVQPDLPLGVNNGQDSTSVNQSDKSRGLDLPLDEGNDQDSISANQSDKSREPDLPLGEAHREGSTSTNQSDKSREPDLPLGKGNGQDLTSTNQSDKNRELDVPLGHPLEQDSTSANQSDKGALNHAPLDLGLSQGLTSLDMLRNLVVTRPSVPQLAPSVSGEGQSPNSQAQSAQLCCSCAEQREGQPPNSSTEMIVNHEKINPLVYVQRQESIRVAVRQQLEQMFKQFAQKTELGVVCQRVVKKWQNMALTWLPGILYCYEIGGLPRHNLELEAVYGKLRANQRRISGRKETSPLRLFGAGEVMNLMINSEAELLEWCQAVAKDKQTYRRERRLQEEAEERQRWLKRLHRHPIQAMRQLDQQFYATLNKLGLMPVHDGKPHET